MYLLSTPNNARRLLQSIDQAERWSAIIENDKLNLKFSVVLSLTNQACKQLLIIV